MSTNSDNKSDKDQEAEIAANQLVKMLEQQALYARIAKINEETKQEAVEDEESGDTALVSNGKRPPKMTILKWSIAASLIVCSLIFLQNKYYSSSSEIALENTEFRGTEYTQSRSTINGKTVRRAFADIDDLIESGKRENAKSLLEAEVNQDEIMGKFYRQGVVAYLDNNYPLAAYFFNKIVVAEDREYIEDAYWNLLLSHKNAGNSDKAKEIAQQMQKSVFITDNQKMSALNEVK